MDMSVMQRMVFDVFLKGQREHLATLIEDTSGRVLGFDEKIDLLIGKVDELSGALETMREKLQVNMPTVDDIEPVIMPDVADIEMQEEVKTDG